MKQLLKLLWITVTVIFVGVYGYQKREIFHQSIMMLDWHILLISLLLIFTAKLLLVTNMFIAAQRFRIELTWIESFSIYNLTQLAKYIPGSVWQFVTRIGILKQRKIEANKIRDSMFAEHGWVMISALILGGLISITAVSREQLASFSNYLPTIEIIYIILFSSIFFLGTASYFYRGSVFRFFRWCLSLRPPISALSILTLVWISMGASLWITFLPFLEQPPSIVYTVGVYCIAYAVGFLVPIAPAGFGIREGVIIIATAPMLGTEVTILLAGLNRLLYLVIELILGGLSVLFKVYEQ